MRVYPDGCEPHHQAMIDACMDGIPDVGEDGGNFVVTSFIAITAYHDLDTGCHGWGMRHLIHENPVSHSLGMLTLAADTLLDYNRGINREPE